MATTNQGNRMKTQHKVQSFKENVNASDAD